MSRFSTLVAQVQDVYPTAGTTEWLIGAVHLSQNRNYNRIVCYVANGSIGQPKGAIGTRDDAWIWTRTVEAVFSIWASSQAQAESRLHALLVALDRVLGSSDDVIGSIREQWYLEGISGNGCPQAWHGPAGHGNVFRSLRASSFHVP